MFYLCPSPNPCKERVKKGKEEKKTKKGKGRKEREKKKGKSLLTPTGLPKGQHPDCPRDVTGP